MIEKRSFVFYLALLLAGLSFVLPAVSIPEGRPFFLGIGLATLAVLILMPIILARFGLPIDRVLYSLAVVLVGLGLSALARLQAVASPDSVLSGVAARQFIWLLAGLAAMAAGTIFGRVQWTLCRYRYLILLAGLLFIGLTIPFGTTVGGARAWLRWGGVQLQPSELARPFVLFFLTSYLGQHQPLLRVGMAGAARRAWRWLLGPVAAMWVLALLLLLWQRDLGMAFLYYAGFLITLYLVSGKAGHLVGGTALGAVGCLAAAAIVPHVRARFLVWFNPLRFVEGAGYQASQGLFALSAGGLLGTGPGLGLPTKVPAVHTDLLFALLGEELGLAGGLAVLLLYLGLIVRGLMLSIRSRDRVGYLFGSVLALSLGLQVFVIAGGTAGLLPLTGLTMPLLSYGGSSLVTTMFSLGVLNGIGGEREGEGLAG